MFIEKFNEIIRETNNNVLVFEEMNKANYFKNNSFISATHEFLKSAVTLEEVLKEKVLIEESIKLFFITLKNIEINDYREFFLEKFLQEATKKGILEFYISCDYSYSDILCCENDYVINFKKNEIIVIFKNFELIYKR